jgi:hypothetical protein
MARWHSCNILHPGDDGRELWNFRAGGDTPKLAYHERKLPNEALTAKVVGKDWQTLYQKKLNVAWLPAHKAFLKVVQIPAANEAEAQSMLDLQLEKLSPMPLQQIVWSFELLPSAGGPLRTAVVTIVERVYVEQFLGKLEEQNYQADRLEVPFLDQLRATRTKSNGAWVYPGLGPEGQACLVAWWYHGVLQNLVLLHVPPEAEAGRYLRQQLAQMAWAGEVEGWLTSPPRWHLVAAPTLAVTWEPWLRGEGDAVEIVAEVPVAEVAALTAQRATSPAPRLNLLPPEYAVRYRQQFIDRIWMRSLGALLMVVVVGTLMYLGALQFLRWQVNTVEKQFQAQGLLYTNVMKIKAEVQVLQDQVDLQFAALECWKFTATLLPSELTLENFNFQRGKTLTIYGTGPAEASKSAGDYCEALGKAAYKEQPLFSKVSTPDLRQMPGQGLRWNLTAELKRNITE